jgi:hypothetical protein
MLGACVLKDNQSRDKCLPYAEFSDNNSYQESIKWHPLNSCMEESAGLLCFGTNRARIKSLDQTSFEKQKDTFTWLERT